MPQKRSLRYIWKTMERKDIRRLALAMFFLFAAIGPLTMLMDTNFLPGSWFRLLFITILSGTFFACIILYLQKPFRLIVLLVLIQAAMFSVSVVEEMVFGRIEAKRIITADHVFIFSQGELDRIQTRRPVFGIIAIFLLSTGYALFIRVIWEENKKRVRLETEVAVARSIQKSLQPLSSFATEWCEVAGVTVPATEVGGDYFDIIKISDDKIAVTIADVSGHGVGAGILSAMTKSALHTELRYNTAPSEVLGNLNNAIYDLTDKKIFVSFAYVLLDRKAMMARVATAGHPLIFLFRKSDETIVEVRTPNLALAVQPSTQYAEETIHLNRGDELILCTDGITEATDDKGEQFGVDRLKELIANTERPSIETLSNSIVASVRAFTIKKEFAEDAIIVVARV